ncbi:tRNA threonylcarbamoyladenosine biosynthesis protein TsaE [bacterium BMS3Bbin14]|nr:tRNA threonylcarbamoyladenosine biosynthesis protein TsaE [bacterium BMS3Abin13]GBE51835.1 tRNA threonylcarbamoyladenosine biosynthesis protein TsaE [bacterium BMS3Bbin14]
MSDRQTNRLVLRLRNLQQTAFLGRFLGEQAGAGDVILLRGPLGAGKTTLAQSIAAGLGVPDECYVTSPSFNLMNEYPGRLTLYHLDCYRLENEYDVEESGLMDYIVADGLTVVEWPERLGSLTPKERLEIDFQPSGEEERTLILTPYGRTWYDRLRSIETACADSFVIKQREVG